MESEAVRGRHLTSRTLVTMAAVGALMFAPVTLWAQVETGSITGNVVDGTGGALPGVPVTATNLSTNQTRTVVTSDRGRYQISGLQPARYSVTVELQGFRTLVRPDVTVNVGSVVDVDFTMALATVEETVTVRGGAPLVESTRTGLSSVITVEQLETLPSKGRQYLDYVLLLPATVENVSTTAQGSGLSIGGARGKESALLVDGFYNMDEGFAKPKQQHSQDSIQEFQVVSFGGAAEYGRAIGGIINAVTKSGGNSFSGTGSAFFRGTKLNAQDWGGRARGAPKAEMTRRQWGGTLGGPIVRDKSFFFGAYERLNEVQPIDNGIRAEDAAIIGLPPEDVGTISWFQRTHFAMGKWDHNISANHRVQASLSMTHYRSLSPLRAFETRSRSWGLHPNDWAVQAKWTGVAGEGRVLHEVKVSYFPRFYYVAGLNEGGPPLTPEGQINQRVQSNAHPPAVSISSVASFGASTLNNNINTYPTQAVYASTIFSGSHTIKFGADFMASYYDYNLPSRLRGSYSFSSLQNFVAGNYTSYTQGFGNPHNPRWHHYASGFIQDSWKVNDKLTLNYGVRYDWELHPKHPESGERFGSDDNNIAPRFALSYDLTGRSTTFLKIATGIYYDRLFQNLTTFFTDLKGYQRLEAATWRPQDPGAPVYPNVFTERPANLPRGVINTWVMPDDDFGVPATGQVMGTIEHAISPSLAVTGSVVYTRSWDKEHGWDTNLVWDDAGGRWLRPDPNYRVISQYRFGGRAEYLAGIMDVTRRGSRTGFNASLTVARAYDTSNNYGVQPDDQRVGIDGEWGPMADSPRVRGVGSIWYNLTSRMQVSTILRARSGMALNPVASGVDLNGDGNFGDRTPTFGRNSFRQPGNATLDLRYMWRLPLADAKSVSFFVEAYNVLNRKNVLQVNGDYGPDPANPRPRWMEPLTYFPPREVQLGARVTF